MMRHTLVKVAYLVLCFALPVRPQADLIEANSRKAVPDFSLADSKGTTIKLSNYIRQSSVVGLLGYLVRGLQSRNPLVHGVSEEVQRRRSVRCWRFGG